NLMSLVKTDKLRWCNIIDSKKMGGGCSIGKTWVYCAITSS
ncbi:unnamed protein product, partial [marine sediment metagenome]